jgi:signal peptidase II
MTVKGRRIFGLVLAAVVFAIDRGLKHYVAYDLQLELVGLIKLLPFFDLRWTQNFGVSLGMFTATSTEMKLMLITLTALISAGVFVWMMREKVLADIIGLAMVLGGALGNIFDRTSRGFVIDYADLHFGDFRPFLIFNFADAAITIGVLILLARSLLSREKPAKRGDPATEISDA